MKQLMKPNHCLPMAALFLTTLIAGPAAAKKPIPFNGSFQAVETFVTLFPPDVPSPTLLVDASGSGNATHLGRYGVAYEVEVDLDTFFGIGFAHFIATNGDSIFTVIEGQGTVPTEDGVSFIVETHTIVGGTGRFHDATGGFTLDRVINVFTGDTSGSFDGTLMFGNAK